MKKILKNLGEMEKFSESFAIKIFKSKVSKKAVIIGLYGDLGSGKTTFTKSFISAFGVKQTVTSPTFVIEKIYKLPSRQLSIDLRQKAGKPKENKKVGSRASKKNKFKYIIHIDAYRLNRGEEMKDLGWNKISNDPKNIILIEWPEKIADILPKDIKKIEFKFINEDKREVVF